MQSTEQMWESLTSAVRALGRVDGLSVRGVGFDATCSLVLVDKDGKAISIDPAGESQWDVLMWMDHRARAEADHINRAAKGHRVLDFVGGKVSLEMQMPKLLWIKRNLPGAWKRARHFFDLPDYLTWRATGTCGSGTIHRLKFGFYQFPGGA